MDPSSNALLALAQKAAEVVIPEVMQKFFEKRRRQAFEILVEELRTAKIDPEEAAARDDVAAMFVKFYQAMSQGAAFNNLRLMAKILATKTADPSLRTDDFISWADAISGLSYEEVVFQATLHRNYSAARKQMVGRDVSDGQARIQMHKDLVGKGKTFPNEEAYVATGSALLRTGLW